MEIELMDETIRINGQPFGDTVTVDMLVTLLGEPRIQKIEPDKNYRKFMEQRRGKDYFDNCKSLVWDDLGIYSRTDDGKTLVSIGMVLDNQNKTAPHTPHSNYSGTFIINGKDWLSAVKQGQNMFGNYCKLNVKRFVVFAEYQPSVKVPLSDRTEKDFTLIEITHEYLSEKL